MSRRPRLAIEGMVAFTQGRRLTDVAPPSNAWNQRKRVWGGRLPQKWACTVPPAAQA